MNSLLVLWQREREREREREGGGGGGGGGVRGEIEFHTRHPALLTRMFSWLVSAFISETSCLSCFIIPRSATRKLTDAVLSGLLPFISSTCASTAFRHVYDLSIV